MKKLFALMIATVALTGCVLEFGVGSTGGSTWDSRVVACSPADYDYSYTEFDCYDAIYQVELCDPDAYYIRPGCYDRFDYEIRRLTANGCWEYHNCEEW